MRPLHAVLVLLALVAALGGAYLLIRGDESPAGIASAASPEALEAERAAPARGAELDAPSAGAPATARAPRAAEPRSAEPRAARPEPASRSSTALAGRVMDPFGNPVVEAVVYAAAATPWNERVALDEIDTESTPWIRRSEARTDAQGRFRVALEDVARGRLAVRAPGFVPLDGEHALEIGAERDLGDLALEASVVLEGRVVDPGGRGVAGAELRRAPEDALHLGFGTAQGALLAATDADGRFRIDQLAAGPWRLRIHSAEHPEALVQGETTRPGERRTDLVFVLESGHAIDGRVVGAPPGGLAGLVVWAAPDRELGRAPDAHEPPTYRSAEVRGDGTFAVRGLCEGARYRLQGRERGAGRGLELFGRSVTAAAFAQAGERGIELAYRPETGLVFQVVDDASGAPVERFDAAAGTAFPQPLRGEDGRVVREHPQGSARFGDLRPAPGQDTVTLRVDALGYETWERDDIALSAGLDTDLGLVRLKRAPTVTVRVLEQGRRVPIEGARVQLEPVRERQGGALRLEQTIDIGIDADGEGLDLPLAAGSSRRARTDAEGVARLTSLPGREMSIVVRAEGFAPHRSEPIVLPDENHELEVLLGPGGTVVVRVVDARDEPVAGARVQHERPGGPELSFALHGAGPQVTDARGELVFANLEPGTHAFRLGGAESGAMGFTADGAQFSVVQRVRREGGDGREQRPPEWTEVEVVAGETAAVTLVAKSRSGLNGRITEAGLSLAGATVSLVQAGGDEALAGMQLPGMGGGPQARTNGSGEYALPDVEVGEHTLRVTHPSRSMPHDVPVEVVEGGSERDVDLPVTIVRGTVSDAQGKPLAGLQVRAERAQGERRTVRRVAIFVTDGGDAQGEMFQGDGSFAPVLTDERGEYALRGVQPDADLVVRAEGEGVQPGQSKVVRLAPGEERSGVDIELEPGGTLPVEVTRADGTPGALCMVQARFEGGEGVEPKTGFTNQSGRTTLDGLRPGRWRLSCQPMGPGGGRSSEAPEQLVEVAAGDNPPARLSLQ